MTAGSIAVYAASVFTKIAIVTRFTSPETVPRVLDTSRFIAVWTAGLVTRCPIITHITGGDARPARSLATETVTVRAGHVAEVSEVAYIAAELAEARGSHARIVGPSTRD